MTETTTKSDVLRDAASLFTPGTIAERVELQLGVLTQGVVDCMILASGAIPDLTEGPVPGPHVWNAPKSASGLSFQAARSAELRDAARLSEASARLLAGFAKLRGQFSQDFTIRHTSKRGGKNAKDRQRNTTVTHSFSVPQKHAVGEDNVDPSKTQELTRGLAQVAEGLGAAKAAAKAAANEGKEWPKDILRRRFGLPPVTRDREGKIIETPKAPEPPTPLRGS